MYKENILPLKDMNGFCERAELTLDGLGQVYDKYGEFLEAVCSECGGLRATAEQMWKMEL